MGTIERPADSPDCFQMDFFMASHLTEYLTDFQNQLIIIDKKPTVFTMSRITFTILLENEQPTLSTPSSKY